MKVVLNGNAKRGPTKANESAYSTKFMFHDSGSNQSTIEMDSAAALARRAIPLNISKTKRIDGSIKL